MAKVGGIMRPGAVTVARDATIREVAEVMLRRGLPGVTVVDDEGRGGLLDDLVLRTSGPEHLVSDVAQQSVYEVMERFSAECKAASALTAADIMRTDIPPVSENAPALQVADCMADARCDLVPVVRDGKPVGLVTKFDLLRSIHWPQEADSTSDEPETA